MDSSESVFHEDGKVANYPIAPVEVQNYSYVALSAWSEILKDSDTPLSKLLHQKAKKLKKLFNQKFIVQNEGEFSIAFAIDGNGQPLRAVRSAMGHCLWNFVEKENKKGKFIRESIVDKKYISLLVKRLMQPDLFVPQAGIRTLSSESKFYDPQSYHNGSIWPHDTSLDL